MLMINERLMMPVGPVGTWNLMILLSITGRSGRQTGMQRTHLNKGALVKLNFDTLPVVRKKRKLKLSK